MVRIIAGLVLAVFCLAGPARACSTTASSTFCADGWVAQPMGRAKADDQRPGSEHGEDWPDDDGAAEPPFLDDGIYVEGAVAIDDAPVPDEEPL